MQKRAILIVLFSINTLFAQQKNAERLLAQPNKQLSWAASFIRDYCDFCIFEFIGDRAISTKNAELINAIIHDVGMADYCIEFRRMSYAAQTIFGRVNAFVIPSIFTGKKTHSFLYISEDWFDSLCPQEKQMLIRHELMHLKHSHGLKRMVMGSCLSILRAITQVYLLNRIDYRDHNRYWKQSLVNSGTLFVLAIALAKYSRMHEVEADMLALESMTHRKDAASLFKTMKNEIQKPKSRFAIKRWFRWILKPLRRLVASHPPLGERIRYTEQNS